MSKLFDFPVKVTIEPMFANAGGHTASGKAVFFGHIPEKAGVLRAMAQVRLALEGAGHDDLEPLRCKDSMREWLGLDCRVAGQPDEWRGYTADEFNAAIAQERAKQDEAARRNEDDEWDDDK